MGTPMANFVFCKESNMISNINVKQNASSSNEAFEMTGLQKLRSKGNKKTKIVTKVSKLEPKKKTTKKNTLG